MSPKAAEITSITYKVNIPFGYPPSFTSITLWSDGRVDLCEEDHRIGKRSRRTRIRHNTFARLAALVVEGGFFRLRSSYALNCTDAATVTTKVEAGVRRKTVSNYGGAGPPGLAALEGAVCEIVRRLRRRLPPWTLRNSSVISPPRGDGPDEVS